MTKNLLTWVMSTMIYIWTQHRSYCNLISSYYREVLHRRCKLNSTYVTSSLQQISGERRTIRYDIKPRMITDKQLYERRGL